MTCIPNSRIISQRDFRSPFFFMQTRLEKFRLQSPSSWSAPTNHTPLLVKQNSMFADNRDNRLKETCDWKGKKETHWSLPSAGPAFKTSEMAIEGSPWTKWGLSLPPLIAIPKPYPGTRDKVTLWYSHPMRSPGWCRKRNIFEREREKNEKECEYEMMTSLSTLRLQRQQSYSKLIAENENHCHSLCVSWKERIVKNGHFDLLFIDRVYHTCSEESLKRLMKRAAVNRFDLRTILSFLCVSLLWYCLMMMLVYLKSLLSFVYE